MGSDFVVEYRAGKHNKVDDALSHCLEDHPCLASISMPSLHLFDSIRQEIQQSEPLQLIMHNIQLGEVVGPWNSRMG